LTISSCQLSSISAQYTISWLLLPGMNLLWVTNSVAIFALSYISVTSVLFMLMLRRCIAGNVLLPLLIWKRKDLHLIWRDLKTRISNVR